MRLIGEPVFPVELSFELSVGEVILMVAVIVVALLLASLRRSQKISETKMTHAQATRSPFECPARFGFLKKLPRGSLIPDEYYVCARLIECLGFRYTHVNKQQTRQS